MTRVRREFVATVGDHRVEFDMCFSDNDQAFAVQETAGGLCLLYPA